MCCVMISSSSLNRLVLNVTSMNSMIVNLILLNFSMDGSDICFEIVRRATAGFVYSEAVARY